MNLAQIVKRRAESDPERAAIIDTRRGRPRRLTFSGLEGAAARAATLLHRTGLRPGDGVLVLHPISAELYVVLDAILRLGLVAMLLDPSAGREHIERSCSLYPPKALIASARAHALRLLVPALRRIPLKFAVGAAVPGAANWSISDRLPPHEPMYPATTQTAALLTFTSGSTGEPKAAVRTHGFLLAQHHALARSLDLKPGEMDLSTLPIFVLANLASGVTSLIPHADLRTPGRFDPGPVIAQIKTYEPTRTVASPAFLEHLVDHCTERGIMLSGFTKICTGGGPVFPRLLAKLQSIAPRAEIVAVYGSTEAEPIARISYAEMQAEDLQSILAGRGLLAGAPVSGIELRILPDRWGRPIGPYTRAQFDAACLRSGQAGEIVVSGKHVLPGYLNGRGDEETKFRVEGAAWHRTGDAGYLDRQGRLWLLGRCSARISDRHGTLYPLAVECVAHHHPGVRRAAVISRAGRRILGIEPWRPGAADLHRLKTSLAWAHVDEIHILRHIPVDRRHSAKIDYPALHELLEKSDRHIPLRSSGPYSG